MAQMTVVLKNGEILRDVVQLELYVILMQCIARTYVGN